MFNEVMNSLISKNATTTKEDKKDISIHVKE